MSSDAGQGTDQHEQGAARQVEVGEQRIDSVKDMPRAG